MRCNAEDRDELLKAKNWTMEQLESDPNLMEYHEPKVPLFFLFVFNCFIEIYNHSGESMTWTDIYNYAKIRKIDFTQNELDTILKCNSWAQSKIHEMKEQE